MAKRFTKATLIEQLIDLAQNVQKWRKFDSGNGTAQLRPRVCDEATQALIDRAVDYGRWITLRNLAADVECGSIGVGKGEKQ